MIRHFILFCVGVSVAISFGCERSKLRENMMQDSTWESSAGDESWEAAEKPPKQDDAWEEKNAPMEGADESKPESRLDQPYPRARTGVIARADLVPVLDQGLGRFLQNVKTEPTFHKGAFAGFRILSLFPGEPAFASLDLRPGDTVVRINGRPIERPEQAVAVWEELRTASNLVVQYRRDGEPLSLRFRIVDES